jgi:hypothetical protein
MNELELLTVNQLKDKLVELGMPREDVDTFKTKAPLIATINTMLAKDATEPEVVEEVKKVATLEEAPNPVEDREINRRWLDKAKRMQDHLEQQEFVSILIPLEPTEKVGVVEERVGKDGRKYQVHISGAIETVTLNGFKTMIPKGRYVPVRRQIAEVISESQQQTLEAGGNISIDRVDPRTGKPLSEVL